MKVSIVIPSFNEAKTLPKIIEKVLFLKFDKEIIVVDDGSRDNTQKNLLKFAKNPKVRIITNKKNLGKGSSIIKALKIAEGDVILIQDADLEYDPADIPKMIEIFKDRNIDVVYGSRILGNNPISHWTFNLGGRLVTAITNFLYNARITDEPTGYKAFRKSVLKNISLKSKGFEFCPEFTAKIAKAGFKISEVPIAYRPRPVSEKKIKWHDGIAAIYYLIKYRFFD